MKLTQLYIFCEQRGLTDTSLSSNATQHKRKFGEYPKWFIKKGKTVFINEDEFDWFGKLSNEVWKYNTDTDGIFFILTEHYGISEKKLSSYLARKSEVFKIQASWHDFLKSSMFAINDIQNKIKKEYTMQIDFLRHGSRLIYDIMKGSVCLPSKKPTV